MKSQQQLIKLNAPGYRKALQDLADEIRLNYVPYQTLSNQDAMTQFIEIGMREHRLNILLYQTDVLLGDAQPEDWPVMPPLLRQALRLESIRYPKLVYAELLYLTTLENEHLKNEVATVEGTAKDEVAKMTSLLDRLNPQHQLRAN